MKDAKGHGSNPRGANPEFSKDAMRRGGPMGGGRGKSLMQTNGRMAAQEMRQQLLTHGSHAARYGAGRARAGGFLAGVRKFFGG